MRLRTVSWWFTRRAVVLDGIDLDVRAGECVVVRGLNGSGKTTLARVGAGALIPKRGQVERTARISYVPQASDNPPIRLRTDRFLSALARVRGIEASSESVDALGLRTAMRRPLNELSTGTITKVLIAAGVSGAPELLVCDEPFADLDTAARAALHELLERLRAGGTAILLTDHSDESHDFADRELLLENGKFA